MPGQLSKNGFEFVKKHEGFLKKPYKAVPSEKYWTVGWGHYGPDVVPGRTYTEAECEAFFMQDKKVVEDRVNKVWHEPMTQSMFDALFSLAYNCGNIHTTVMKNLLAGNGWQNVAKVRDTWTKFKITAGGKVLKGLVNRRRDEVDLFYSDNDGGGLMTSASTYAAPAPGGYGDEGSMESYDSVMAGAQLNAIGTASSVYGDTGNESVKHTRIYKATEPTILVDELSLPMNERILADADITDKEEPETTA